MGHTLSVLVQIDLHGAHVRLVVTGCVTEANQHALHPVIARARTLIPPVTVSLDLSCAEHVEAGAVDLLRWEVEHDGTADGVAAVEVLAPAHLPDHHPVHRSPTGLVVHRTRTGARGQLPKST